MKTLYTPVLMNLARLGEESVERFGEHPALRLSAQKWLDATEVAS